LFLGDMCCVSDALEEWEEGNEHLLLVRLTFGVWGGVVLLWVLLVENASDLC
jgi:hypothetical protein